MGATKQHMLEAQWILEQLDLVDAFAEAHPHFDCTFTNSLAEQFERLGALSDKQRAALLNIIEKWKMPEWEGR